MKRVPSSSNAKEVGRFKLLAEIVAGAVQVVNPVCPKTTMAAAVPSSATVDAFPNPSTRLFKVSATHKLPLGSMATLRAD